MSTLPGNPHHTVVIDLLHPASPRLECNAPADAVLAALATPTPAMVEAGAKALFEESQGLDQDNSWDDPLPDEWRAAWRAAAEAVITAALTAAFKEGEA